MTNSTSLHGHVQFSCNPPFAELVVRAPVLAQLVFSLLKEEACDLLATGVNKEGQYDQARTGTTYNSGTGLWSLDS